jgi:ATP-binding cassette subfamily B multidrug efflux pump
MNHLRTLLPYLRPYRWGIAAGLFLVVLADLFWTLPPSILGRALDALNQPVIDRGQILRYAGLIVGFAALGGLARWAMREFLNGISRRVENDLRDSFFDHLLRLDARFYNSTRIGDLMSRAINDIGAVRMAIGPAVMYLVNTAFTTGLALFFMLRISPKLTLIALIPLIFMPPVVIFFGRIIHERFAAIQEHFSVMSTMVQENLSGVRIVRAYTQEAAQEREFATLSRKYEDMNMHLARTSAVFQPLLTVFSSLGVLITVWFGGREAMAGRITAGDFVAFSTYLAMLTWPMIALGWVTNMFQRGAASMSRLNSVFRQQPAIASPSSPRQLSEIRGEIEFRDVSFRYGENDRDVLNGINFHVAAGATVALVGPTGSGKSTVVALLTRRYDPTGGTVLLDGVPVHELSLEQLRGAIGVVPQDAFVFSQSIAENVGFGLPRGLQPRERIEEAGRIARLDEAVALFPKGYDTRLGERGVNLSGGQRQRATLARAIARDPKVLVLDDALSAVDTHTETEILENLKRVLAGRTALIVSHRVSAVMNADQILVLDQGRIVERGTHAELIARAGLYGTLLRRQLLEEDLGAELAESGSDTR